MAAESWDEQGRSVVGRVGELVITAPMPSMPVRFWGDEDGARYRASYFETFPGVWRHGDFFELNERGGCFVRGRSDAVLNRQGCGSARRRSTAWSRTTRPCARRWW
ncbi:hypothetical protein [Blastococcus brunescens]|uniref:AMP-dependent synthetase/ligase domain-containing protein n=1 Tax=Blastococcus brunescens TaxID=1564165 RepID=A0ABZ1B3H4_9ACTN|nr:hypothetical protein [Blastococcus sp. BMG 8361]WRL65294.1 hypothetical protein U6N30_06470 [Blastococcus sp. BMG 8361]